MVTNLSIKMDKLEAKIKKMFFLVSKSLEWTMMSLRTAQHHSDETRALDAEIDELELRIDALCIALLVSEQPYATDLRYIFTTGKTVKDLERIGDECGNIMREMRKMKKVSVDDLVELVELGNYALKMFNNAQDSFLTKSIKNTKKILDLEEKVDQIEKDIITKSGNTQIILMARGLERIGDLSTNLAENVIFNLKGKDIRHGQFENWD